MSQRNSNEDKRPELSVSLYINLPLHFKRKCILKRTSIAGEFLGFKLFLYRWDTVRCNKRNGQWHHTQCALLPIIPDSIARHQEYVVHLRIPITLLFTFLPMAQPSPELSCLWNTEHSRWSSRAKISADLPLIKQHNSEPVQKRHLSKKTPCTSATGKLSFRKCADRAEKCSNLRGAKLDSKNIYLLSENDSWDTPIKCQTTAKQFICYW